MSSFVPIPSLTRQSSRREIYDAIDDLSVFHQHHALFPKAPSWDRLYACVRSYKRSHPAVGNIATAYRHHRLQLLGQLTDSAKTPSIDRLRKRKDRACKKIKRDTSTEQQQQPRDEQPQPDVQQPQQAASQQQQRMHEQPITAGQPQPHSHAHPHPHPHPQRPQQQQQQSPPLSVPSTPSPTSFLSSSSSSSSSSFVDASPLPSRGGCRCGAMVEVNLRLHEELRRKDAELAALREKLSLMRGLIDGTAEQPAELILSSLPPAFPVAHELQSEAADEWPDFIPALWSGSGGKQCVECSCCAWKAD